MSKKKKKGITVKVIPAILTPDEVREKIVSVLEARTPIYSEDTRKVAAKILEGITIVQVEDVEEKAEPRVWERIQDVPEGVYVRDIDEDTLHWADGELYIGDFRWGPISFTHNSTFGPFTEVVE